MSTPSAGVVSAGGSSAGRPSDPNPPLLSGGNLPMVVDLLEDRSVGPWLAKKAARRAAWEKREAKIAKWQAESAASAAAAAAAAEKEEEEKAEEEEKKKKKTKAGKRKGKRVAKAKAAEEKEKISAVADGLGGASVAEETPAMPGGSSRKRRFQDLQQQQDLEEKLGGFGL